MMISMIVKLWLTILILLCGLSEEQPENSSVMKAINPVDPEAEERLRERWTAFVAEVNKELSFDLNASSPSLVSVVNHRDLYLTCAFSKPLRRHQISFLRLSDFSLLFVGESRHTRDQRFSVSYSPDGLAWTLRLKNIQFEDRGLYECQVNTSPEAISLVLNVTVLGGRTRILPPDPLIYVNSGGQLSLHCVIETGPVRPQFILWYKADKLVEYSSKTASVGLSSNGTDHVSTLRVDNVSIADSGLYRCDSDLTDEAAIQVYVVEQDFKSLYLGSHDKALITATSSTSSSSLSSSSSSKNKNKGDNTSSMAAVTPSSSSVLAGASLLKSCSLILAFVAGLPRGL